LPYSVFSFICKFACFLFVSLENLSHQLRFFKFHWKTDLTNYVFFKFHWKNWFDNFVSCFCFRFTKNLMWQFNLFLFLSFTGRLIKRSRTLIAMRPTTCPRTIQTFRSATSTTPSQKESFRLGLCEWLLLIGYLCIMIIILYFELLICWLTLTKLIIWFICVKWSEDCF
jgi:hypothetical protein